MLILFALVPFASTLAGGAAALRLRHRLHPFMALAAGVLVATALVDLLPEAGSLLGDGGGITAGAATVLGFLLYSALELLVHHGSLEHGSDERIMPPGHRLALLAPAGLIVHSTLDGLAIGTGFLASPEIGLLVLLAVAGHDFADGLNVVTLGLAGGAPRRTVITLLALDALAPVAGVLAAGALAVSHQVLGLGLGVFAGAFLAISTGHLLPEARHHEGSDRGLWALMAGGAGLAIIIRLAAGT